MTLQPANRPTDGQGDGGETRSCPFCDAAMARDAILCQQCDRFSKLIVPAAQITRSTEALIPRANAAIARWESNPQIERRLGLVFAPVNLNIPRSVRLGVAAVLLLLGAAMGLLWLRYGGWEQAQGVFALLVTGCSLLFSDRLIRPEGKPVVEQSETPPDSASIRLFGYDLNLAVAQAMALGSMIMSAVRFEIDVAWNCALVTTMFVLFLWKTKYIIFTILAGLAAFLYIVYIWIVYDFEYLVHTNNNALEMTWSLAPIAPFILMILFVALVPHLQLLKVGKLGVGRFKGDASVILFGSDVPIAITSSVILVSTMLAAQAVWYAPRWLPTALTGG